MFLSFEENGAFSIQGSLYTINKLTGEICVWEAGYGFELGSSTRSDVQSTKQGVTISPAKDLGYSSPPLLAIEW